jgi:hypothetical protein
MKIKVIKQGNTLQLTENLNLPDGQEIMIVISDSNLNNSKNQVKWDDFADIIGAWKNDQEITEIFAEIEQERHQDLGRDVNF